MKALDPVDNGQRPILLFYGTLHNSFWLDEDRFLNREVTFCNSVKRERMRFFEAELFFPLLNAFIKL
jgi:hypothetical protein